MPTLGNDILFAPVIGNALIYGDIEFVQTSVPPVTSPITGGNDRIYSGIRGVQTLIGDAQFVEDGMLTGGADLLDARTLQRGESRLFGDASSTSPLFGRPVLIGGADRILGSEFLGDIIGGDANSVANTDFTGGADAIYGFGGADLIAGDAISVLIGSSDVSGGNTVAGSDLVFGGAGADSIFGDCRTFVNISSFALPTFTGGDDTLHGDEGNDIVVGDVERWEDADMYFGDDRLFGGAGNDKLYGDYQIPFLSGGFYFTVGGNDLIYGGDGVDQAWGNEGNDTLFGDGGNDVLRGEADADKLYGGLGDDVLYGGAGDDVGQGEAGNDRLNGDDGNDRLFGGDGDDSINGGNGGDYVQGGAGNDIISGSGGNDRLFGGAGADRFRFFAGQGMDRVFDFENDVDQLEFNTGLGFADAAAVIAATTAAGSDALIDLGGGNELRLVGYLAANTIASLGDDIVIF